MPNNIRLGCVAAGESGGSHECAGCQRKEVAKDRAGKVISSILYLIISHAQCSYEVSLRQCHAKRVIPEVAYNQQEPIDPVPSTRFPLPSHPQYIPAPKPRRPKIYHSRDPPAVSHLATDRPTSSFRVPERTGWSVCLSVWSYGMGKIGLVRRI